ncbi:MAG: pilus assembly protein [Planctomycetes bacterium]|nr:pilus assembly protein [Planctomycetota bacterium]
MNAVVRTRSIRTNVLTDTTAHGSFHSFVKTTTSHRRGAIIVELALVMPFFFMLILGMCEVGQVMRVQTRLTQAVRKGCATGCRPSASNDDVIADVRDSLLTMGLQGGAVDVKVLVNDHVADIFTAKRGDKVTVKATVSTAKITWTGSTYFIGSDSVQTATLSMLKQR